MTAPFERKKLVLRLEDTDGYLHGVFDLEEYTITENNGPVLANLAEDVQFCAEQKFKWRPGLGTWEEKE